MSEQPVALDIDLILQSLKFRQMYIDSIQSMSYEYRQSELQRVDAVVEQIRARQISSLDSALILESLTQTRRKFEDYEYDDPKLKQQQLERVNNALAQVRALRDKQQLFQHRLIGRSCMAQIHTFYGNGENLNEVIAEAEAAAADFLKDLTADQILSVQAQTIATPWKTEASTQIMTQVHTEYTHVITIVST